MVPEIFFLEQEAPLPTKKRKNKELARFSSFENSRKPFIYQHATGSPTS